MDAEWMVYNAEPLKDRWTFLHVCMSVRVQTVMISKLQWEATIAIFYDEKQVRLEYGILALCIAV